MQGLKVSELQEGKIYVCRLSALNFMVMKQQAYTTTDTQMGRITSPKGDPIITWKYYNPVTGDYSTNEILDYQLCEL